jgi:hypothetical protein
VEYEQKKSSLFPHGTHLPYFPTPVYAGIVEYDKCLFGNPERILFEEINDLLGVYGLTSRETFKMVVTVNHTEDIEPLCPFRGYVYVFFGKFPSIRDVTFGTDMRFIAIEEVDFSLGIKCFKFLQLPDPVLIELRRGDSLWTFSYTSISCARADKKRLNVNSLASLPDAFCQAFLAARTLWRSDSMALRTASSSELSITGLRPCPGWVRNPLIPSDSNRFTQPLMLWAVTCFPHWDTLKIFQDYLV